ncbi:caspase-14-like [Dreissena polymorpha]|uniref:Caspase-3 n=1 Tax=Dreissena polymorpha TaxID=45954 RepID=A0A9D4K1X0_DREPO|nr:caspase-14-like [Dreissena polymorpha]XP_052284843.1 caspase-14-like [Dreissena polymorpha]KAH3828648.1 hypothetical protein DPMN_130629 [Dreissena polymorpha]
MGCVNSSNSSDQLGIIHNNDFDDNLQTNPSILSSLISCFEAQNHDEDATPTEHAIPIEPVSQPETQLQMLAIAPLERGSHQQRRYAQFIHPAVLERGLVESIDVAYPTSGKGFVLIINYSHSRQGSEKDVTKLVGFFQHELQHSVLLGNNNMTREELRAFFEDVKKSIDARFYCFICIVMAHGNEKGIITSDGKVQSYNEIIETFDNRNMSAFAGRPKLFLINACRGDRRPWTMPFDFESITMDATPVHPIELVAETSDIYAVYSTVRGFVSTRDTQEGSIFIQTCVDVFQKYYKTRNVCDMTTSIRRKVQHNHMCQVSEAKTTLTKQFYLMKSQ